MSENNDCNPGSTGRRKFLKVAAGSLAALTTARPALADSSGAKEVGIVKAVRQQVKNGKPDRALHLLEKHDVNYDHVRAVVPAESGGESSGIGTESIFDKDPSTIDFFAYETAAPLYNAEMMWNLSPHLSADCVQPNDVAAITYDGSRWQTAGDEWYDYYMENYYSESSGFFGLWDDEVAYVMDGDTSGNIGAVIEKAEPYRGDEQNLWAHYEHTWVPPWKGSCAAAQFFGGDVNLSAGAISVSTTADSWKIRKDPLSI